MRARDGWSWVAVGVTMLAVAGITGIMGAVSYQHEYELARHHGQAPWVSSVLPFTVDGLIFAASVVILWANSQGIRRPVRPLAVLAVGVGATIAANLAAGLGDGWLGAAISAWSGIALILISDVAMWLMGTLRALSSGEAVHPTGACSHPPPPVTLAEALPLARARLQEEGQPFGKEALAERFGVTPHRVRTLLVAAGDRGQGGTSATPPRAEHGSRPGHSGPPAGGAPQDPDRSVASLAGAGGSRGRPHAPAAPHDVPAGVLTPDSGPAGAARSPSVPMLGTATAGTAPNGQAAGG